MCLNIINAQATRKQQIIYLGLKIIQYYRLIITHDKLHEVIQMSVSIIQYSNLISKALINVATSLCYV